MRPKLLLLAALALSASLLAPVALADNGGFTPVQPVSPNATGIKDSYVFISIFVVGIFVLVESLLVLFLLKYRRRARPRFEDGAPIHGSSKLELTWTIFPVVVLFLIAAFIFVKLPGISDIPSARAGDELDVQVTGRQFYWEFQYPNGVVALDTMRVPAGVPVRLQVTAPDSDVIHSWWIPALGGKIDAIPGRVNQTWFQAETPGLYQGQCAELCGVEHALMRAKVEVMPPAEFAAWLDERAGATGEQALGQEEWQGVCAKCHGLNGEGGYAPAIGGSAVLQDPQAVEALIRNGRRKMPAVGAGWTSEQVAALVAYLEASPPSGQEAGS